MKHGTRASVFIVAAGVFLEILTVVTGFVIAEGFSTKGWHWPGELDDITYHSLNEVNCLFSLLCSLVLIYGMLSFARSMSISRSAYRWVFASSAVLFVLKTFDVFNTVFRETADTLFKTFPVMDVLVYNVLILCGSVSILIGFMRALYDANHLTLNLEAQNRRLDSEMGERQQAEGEAHARERQFSTILNALSSPVFLVNCEGYVLAHNEVFARLWGHDRENLIGCHLRQVMPESTFETGKQHAMPLFENGAGDSYRWVVEGRTYDVNVFPVRDAQGNVPSITVLALDVTEKLRDEEERVLLEAAINSAAESILVTDTNGVLEYVNPAFEELSGYSRSELEGRNYQDMGFGRQDEAFYGQVWQTILAGQVWSGNFVNCYRNGKTVHENATISPILDAGGDVHHFITVKRDVTRELQLEQQLQQAQKLEALGTMAGGIAHDMNNVFSIILGRCELALPTLDENEPAHESLEIITKTARRSSKMVKRLLTFARKNVGETGPLHIASMIQEQAKFMHSYLPSNVTVQEDIRVTDEIIIADAAEVQQAFVNLVNNSNYAMQPGGGTLEIGLETVTVERPVMVTTGSLVPGSYVRLRIGDTGYGMDAETQLRMFDPFFSTKAPGEGTGLGLPMVHGSVLRLGGQIDVQSEPGRGTRIDLYWPRAEEGTIIPEQSRHEPVQGRGISVLIIDDLADFVELLKLNLEYYGFRVIAFEDSKAAFAYFKKDPAATDVVVVDFMMPGMNGEELAQEMHALRPDLPIVLLSGYSSGIKSENAGHHGFCGMFEKPVEMAKLTQLLVRVVARR